MNLSNGLLFKPQNSWNLLHSQASISLAEFEKSVIVLSEELFQFLEVVSQLHCCGFYEVQLLCIFMSSFLDLKGIFMSFFCSTQHMCSSRLAFSLLNRWSFSTCTSDHFTCTSDLEIDALFQMVLGFRFVYFPVQVKKPGHGLHYSYNLPEDSLEFWTKLL